jgi:uncharacterized protein
VVRVNSTGANHASSFKNIASTNPTLQSPKLDSTSASSISKLFDNNHKKVPAEIIQQIKAWLESIRQDLANENG